MIFFNKKNVVKDKKKIAEQLSRILTIIQEIEEAMQYQKSKTPNYHEMERLVRENDNNDTKILNDMIAGQEKLYDKILGSIGEVSLKCEALSDQLRGVPDVIERGSMMDLSGLKEDVGSFENKVQNIGLTYSEKTSAFLSSFGEEVKKYMH